MARSRTGGVRVQSTRPAIGPGLFSANIFPIHRGFPGFSTSFRFRFPQPHLPPMISPLPFLYPFLFCFFVLASRTRTNRIFHSNEKEKENHSPPRSPSSPEPSSLDHRDHHFTTDILFLFSPHLFFLHFSPPTYRPFRP